MTESPDFLRNQDFFCTFSSNILLAVFLTQPLTQTGEGWKAPDRARQDFSCPALYSLS